MHDHRFPESLEVLGLDGKLIGAGFQLLETKPAVRVRRGSKPSDAGAQLGASTQNGGSALILHDLADTLGCLCTEWHDQEQRHPTNRKSAKRHLALILTQINYHCKP